MRARNAVLAALAAVLLMPAGAHAAAVVKAHPWLSAAGVSITSGADGSLWVAQLNGRVVHLSRTGEVLHTRDYGTQLGQLALAPDGRVWLAVRGGQLVVAFDPVTHTTSSQSTLDASDCGPYALAVGGDGYLYASFPSDPGCTDPGRVARVLISGSSWHNVTDTGDAYDLHVHAGKVFVPSFQTGEIRRFGTGTGWAAGIGPAAVAETTVSAPDAPLALAQLAGRIVAGPLGGYGALHFPATQNGGSATATVPPGGAIANPLGMAAYRDTIAVAGTTEIGLLDSTMAFSEMVRLPANARPGAGTTTPDGDAWFVDVDNARLLQVTPAPEPPAQPEPQPPAPPQPPAVTPPAPIVQPAAPKLATLLAVPSSRRCVSRRRFRITIKRRAAIRSVSVKVGSRKAKVASGRALRRPVDLRGLPKGTFAVRITVTLSDGRRVMETRRYRTCTPKRRRR